MGHAWDDAEEIDESELQGLPVIIGPEDELDDYFPGDVIYTYKSFEESHPYFIYNRSSMNYIIHEEDAIPGAYGKLVGLLAEAGLQVLDRLPEKATHGHRNS